MTEEKRRRVLDAIAECNRYIRAEERRDANLRPPDIALRLAFYRAHKDRLLRMLAAEVVESL